MLRGIIVVPTVCNQVLECGSVMHIYLHRILWWLVGVAQLRTCGYSVCAGTDVVSYTTCITTELCYM